MVNLKSITSISGRAIGANFCWLAADKLMRLIFGLLVSAWVARYLGPERFGILAYVMTFIAIFQAALPLGLDNLVVRDVAVDHSQAHRSLGTALGLRIMSAISFYLLMLLIAAIFHCDEEQTFFAIAVSGLAFFFQVSDVVDLWFQSQFQSRRTVLAKGVSYLLTSCVKVLLILSGAGLVVFAAAYALEAALALFAISFSYRQFRTTEKWVWSVSKAVELLRQSWPLLLSGVSILLYMRVGIVFLRNSAGNAEVGIYTVGASLSELWYFIPTALASSLAPYISRKRAEGWDAYQRVIIKAFSAMWLISIAVATFNVLTAKYWIALLYGDQYIDSASIFAVHALTFIPVCLGVMQSIWLINEGRSKLAFYHAITGAAVAITLNFLLIPPFGAYGAAVVTVISQFVQAFLVNAVLAPDLFRIQLRSLRFVEVLRH